MQPVCHRARPIEPLVPATRTTGSELPRPDRPPSTFAAIRDHSRAPTSSRTPHERQSCPPGGSSGAIPACRLPRTTARPCPAVCTSAAKESAGREALVDVSQHRVGGRCGPAQPNDKGGAGEDVQDEQCFDHAASLPGLSQRIGKPASTMRHHRLSLRSCTVCAASATWGPLSPGSATTHGDVCTSSSR